MEEVHRDVSLTFANAKLFNPPATDVHVMATTLEEFWAPRWEAIKLKVREVDEGMAIEKEAAERKSEEMAARRELGEEEMRCAGLMADLDRLRRQLEDLKRQSARRAKPMDARESEALMHAMKTLPRGFRERARSVVAETEGGHKGPVDAETEQRWGEVLEDLDVFGALARRRLARFAKTRKRNQEAVMKKWRAPDQTSRAEFTFRRGVRVFGKKSAAEGGGEPSGISTRRKRRRATTPRRRRRSSSSRCRSSRPRRPPTSASEREDPLPAGARRRRRRVGRRRRERPEAVLFDAAEAEKRRRNERTVDREGCARGRGGGANLRTSERAGGTRGGRGGGGGGRASGGVNRSCWSCENSGPHTPVR